MIKIDEKLPVRNVLRHIPYSSVFSLYSIQCNLERSWISISHCKINRVKVPENRPQKAQRESRGIALLFVTSALEGGGWSAPHPGHLTPGKTQYHQGRSGRVREISPPPGFDPRIVQLVASRYTD
jgi:hypothetical protein